MSKEVRLTKGKVAIVDNDDFGWINQDKWNFDEKTGYAKRIDRSSGKVVRVKMHRAIMGNPDGMDIDHINGNKLDNRKENLRIVTNHQNKFNRGKTSSKTTSKYKGVSLTKEGKWIAQIQKDGKKMYLGIFRTEISAAIAYNEAAKDCFGEYARLNEIT